MRLREPELISIYTENARFDGTSPVASEDVRVGVSMERGRMHVNAVAQSTPLCFIRLRWRFTPQEKTDEPVHVLGDVWERAYGDMTWQSVIPERCMPWSCCVSNGSDAISTRTGRKTSCYGVRVRPAALCFWQYDSEGVTLWADVRCGGLGVILNGRELPVCDVVFAEYENISAFEAVCAFERLLCSDPILPSAPVYGGNNWYYAYGKSSHEAILEDSRLLAELCEGLTNRPAMVIDDGWQPNPCDGPWHEGNRRFPDMARLASEMRQIGVRPGLWVRLLADERHETPGVSPEERLMRDERYLDPSHPAVLERIARDIRHFTQEWGFEIIKHDFSTYDLFGRWGSQCPDVLAQDQWHFYDRSRTSAEVVLALYQTIREAAGPQTVLIGCNVIGHLAAGLVELNRVGDDTSGVDWERTRKYGVHALAFRLPHHNSLYAVDADCVGITGKINWAQNREWLRVLAQSGTPLFVSCQPGVLGKAELQELREALARASVQQDVMQPLDWMENSCPSRWLVNGQEQRFSWLDEAGACGFAPMLDAQTSV